MIKYSYYRIKHIMQDDFNLDLIKIPSGYKGLRFRVQTYYLADIDTNEKIMQDVTLDALRIFLTEKGYPLKES